MGWLMGLGLGMLAAAAQASTPLQGRIFADLNGDGQPGADEPGIAGVKVSNGRDVVFSDADGHYQLDLVLGDTMFVIRPPGWDLPRDPHRLPKFWQHEVASTADPVLRYGGRSPQRANGLFGLRPRAAAPAETLRALVFGDPQPKTLVDVDYFRRDIVEPLRDQHQATLGLSLGDIVHDDLSLYPALTAVTTQLGLPWLHVSGNHDLDFDARDDAGSLESFRQFFGPDTFAWEERNAVFIILDDVIYQPGQRPEYIGGLRPEQFSFLESYLPTLDDQRLVVLALHIPLFDAHPVWPTFRAADRQRLFQLLARFPHRLVLSAHSHAQQHVFHDADDGWPAATPLHEYNVGTACGGYWSGLKDAEGIPDSRMADGTPNGYATIEVDPDAQYRLFWQVARDHNDPGLSLHGPQVLRRGSWPGVGLFANVYMADRESRVELRIDGGDWRPMRRVDEPDPTLLLENLLDDQAAALRSYDRLPQAEKSSHLWRFNLPTELDEGEHQVEVRTFDRWRGELRAQHRYRLLSVQP